MQYKLYNETFNDYVYQVKSWAAYSNNIHIPMIFSNLSYLRNVIKYNSTENDSVDLKLFYRIHIIRKEE